MNLSDTIRKLRNERNWSQATLGEKIDVDDALIRKWENGKRRNIWFESVEKLADAFEVSMDVFRQDKSDDPFVDGIPLRFGSSIPNEKQKQILDFCNAYLETLDGEFFVKGTGQNSEYGTGRYFWESKIDLLMFIGFTPSFLKSHPEYALSVCINTEKRLSETELADFNVLQITDGEDENWIYVPIRCAIGKEDGLYTNQLRVATDTALFTVMQIARKTLEINMNNFINKKRM